MDKKSFDLRNYLFNEIDKKARLEVVNINKFHKKDRSLDSQAHKRALVMVKADVNNEKQRIESELFFRGSLKGSSYKIAIFDYIMQFFPKNNGKYKKLYRLAQVVKQNDTVTFKKLAVALGFINKQNLYDDKWNSKINNLIRKFNEHLSKKGIKQKLHIGMSNVFFE